MPRRAEILLSIPTRLLSKVERRALMPHRPLQQVALPLVLLLPRVHILVVVLVRVIVAGGMVAEAAEAQVNLVPVGGVDLLRVHQDRPQVEAGLVGEQRVPELVPVVIMMRELE